MAQRVVRRVHGLPLGRRGHPVQHAWTTLRHRPQGLGYRQDQLPSTHPIVADAPDIETVKANFDGITYAKGASVLRQLVAWVGRGVHGGAPPYFAKHAWGNTTLADLLASWRRRPVAT